MSVALDENLRRALASALRALEERVAAQSTGAELGRSCVSLQRRTITANAYHCAVVGAGEALEKLI
jgi:hypothetical protein